MSTTDPRTRSHPVLASEVDDRRLAAEAFTVLGEPVLTPEGAAALRDEFGRIYGWESRGWYNAFNDPEPEARQRADAVLGEHLYPILRSLFVGYEPFLSTYLVKWPGEEQHANFLYLHRDWMYIDETETDRTFVLFLALQDIEERNGAVHVLPRGNNLDHMLRGTGMVAPWLRHTDVIRPRMELVPLAAGHAAVWDGAVVHSSGPNLTDEPRVAVGIWLRPTGRQLVHFRRVDAHEATRHLVDPGFFLRQSSHTVDAHLADHADAPRFPVGEVDMTADELAAALDQLDGPEPRT